MAGCMIETMTGLSAGIQMAMGTAAFDHIDLDSIHYLRHKDRYGRINIDGRALQRRISISEDINIPVQALKC